MESRRFSMFCELYDFLCFYIILPDGALRGGWFQESFFQRFSKSIEKVAVPATADTFFYVFETFRFGGSFSEFPFPNHKRFFAQILKNQEGQQIEKLSNRKKK